MPSTNHPSHSLLAPELPTAPGLLRRLVQHYFDNVHHLRCFGFVHKPSFMRQIDRGLPPTSEEAPLRHVICAHGAKFCALEYSLDVRPLSSRLIHEAGNAWARAAESMIMANYGRISVPYLMVRIIQGRGEGSLC